MSSPGCMSLTYCINTHTHTRVKVTMYQQTWQTQRTGGGTGGGRRCRRAGVRVLTRSSGNFCCNSKQLLIQTSARLHTHSLCAKDGVHWRWHLGQTSIGWCAVDDVCSGAVSMKSAQFLHLSTGVLKPKLGLQHFQLLSEWRGDQGK